MVLSFNVYWFIETHWLTNFIVLPYDQNAFVSKHQEEVIEIPLLKKLIIWHVWIIIGNYFNVCLKYLSGSFAILSLYMGILQL